MRAITQEELCHDRLGDEFERALSTYDTRRRVETLIDEFLTDDMVAGKETLDVGCGLGYFSKRLAERGAKLIACDIGPNLVQRTRDLVGCRAEVADALELVQQFGPDRFDLVVSSECIEHTPSPQRALEQMAAVLKPGGYLAVSTPNIVWSPVVKLATALRLRPFDGHERFSSWSGIRRVLRSSGIEIVREAGLHLFPFQFPLHRLSTWCDRRLQPLRPLMINVCVLGRKRG
jgi:2-polyprenyl-3-methyl-5-hydroxy-6-metoxy-1,4-benzoquinol methylase